MCCLPAWKWYAGYSNVRDGVSRVGAEHRVAVDVIVVVAVLAFLLL